jgi:nucleoside-diphosphate-sugar epimerase
MPQMLDSLWQAPGLVYDEDAVHPGMEEDAVHPKLAYPASKVAAENELRNSGLNWSILRLPFVYGDGDEHLASVPRVMASMKWHPARTFSMAHQRDVARAFELALTGVMDGRIVNIVDDAPMTLYEMANIVGASIEPSAEPLSLRARCHGSHAMVQAKSDICSPSA